MTYISTKTYGHETGLSACFRQHRAHSHCRFMHGYALAFRLEFEAEELDHNGWVVDFGSLKSFKGALEQQFDHKTLVAFDDPKLPLFTELHEHGLIQLREVPATGCEAFAMLVYQYADVWLADNGYAPRVRVRSVTCSEHAGNSAIYTGGAE